jgi:Asp-tRNA(Asn)/Glu-tRNA(Gln) amidotransferase A subunit family amidase
VAGQGGAVFAHVIGIIARRMIGARQLSPVELLASCRARIDAVNHAVKAVTDTIWPRAVREAKAAEQAVRTLNAGVRNGRATDRTD